MATKVEKRKVRKQQNAEAMGINLDESAKKADASPKKKKLFNLSENEWKWFLFSIEIILIIIMLAYNARK